MYKAAAEGSSMLLLYLQTSLLHLVFSQARVVQIQSIVTAQPHRKSMLTYLAIN